MLPGRDPALLPKQEGAAVFSADLTTSEYDGAVVVALHGELDIVDAAAVAAALVTAAVRDLLLAAPRQQVLKVLTITRLVDDFRVHASVDEAVGSLGGGARRAVMPG